jgi:hypothetical protein
MSKQVSIKVEMSLLRFPKGVNQRLQQLLDKQDGGAPRTAAERKEAEGLVELADLVSLLKLRAQGAAQDGGS